ncbi:MAG: hypothetical protein ACRERV_03860 [Methylococcales bacterium]
MRIIHASSSTEARFEDRNVALRHLWDLGEISNADYLSMILDREDARISGLRLQGKVWKA